MYCEYSLMIFVLGQDYGDSQNEQSFKFQALDQFNDYGAQVEHRDRASIVFPPEDELDPAEIFSNEEEGRVVEFYRDHPVLYDQNHDDFCDNRKKDKIWIECDKFFNKLRESIFIFALMGVSV